MQTTWLKNTLSRSWIVELHDSKKQAKAFKILQQKESGQAIESVHLDAHCIVLTWRQRGEKSDGRVKYKTAFDLVSGALKDAGGFSLRPHSLPEPSGPTNQTTWLTVKCLRLFDYSRRFGTVKYVGSSCKSGVWHMDDGTEVSFHGVPAGKGTSLFLIW